MNQMLIRSSLARDFEIHTVNTSKGTLRWAVERQSWRTPVDFVRHLGRLLIALGRVRPDIVYVHAASGISFTRDWVLMVVARLSGARVVCHYHGTLHTVFPSVRTRFGRWCGRWMMRAAHRVVVLGPTYAREMGIAWGRDPLWSPNLVDLDLFRGLQPEDPVPWLESGDRAVLFVGRLSAPKGIGELFDAIPAVLARHPEARFVLCGVAESEGREPVLREEVARRGFAPRVSFLGSLEGRDKARAYVSSKVFVAPSWTEAFPLVIPEAMAAGVPLVVTSVGVIPDFVKDGEDGFLIPPRDANALADAICRLLDDESMRSRMSRHVRERAPKEFAIEVGAERVGAVLHGLLAGRSAVLKLTPPR
jgi:glycosyltransferase involved in cell wall biosynthesis